MSTGSTRAVHCFRGAYWWCLGGFAIITVSGLSTLTLSVVERDREAILPGAFWLVIVALVARVLWFSAVWRLEVDSRSIYWRRRGKEQSAPLAEVASITSRAEKGTVWFRGGRRRLKVHVGREFEDFAEYVRRHGEKVALDLRTPTLMRGHLLFGGKFTAPGQQR